MKRTIAKGVVFIVAPLCLLEVMLRAGILPAAPDTWYRPVATAVCRGHVDFVFVGSSRVAAAIHAEAFSRRVAALSGRPVNAVNLGRGYTTLVEHELAVRQLYETCPAQMKDATVLVEASEGLMEFSTFHDPWVHPDDPRLIVPLLRRGDVVRLWRESATPLQDKVELTARLLRSVDYIDVTRRRLLNVGDRVEDFIAAHRRGAAPAAAADLTSAGGVLTDAAGVERARRLAVTFVASMSRDDERVEDWSSSVLMDFNQMVRAHGGRMIVYRMPVSSVFKTPLETPGRRRAAAGFQRAVAAADIPYLPVSFLTGDEDFPDAWHLRKSRADEFSQRLAEDFLALRPQQLASR
jgi:hypothetical protein